MADTTNQKYTNTYGKNVDDKWANQKVGDVTLPEHSWSRMSNENFDRMAHTPSVQKNSKSK